jgi:hypothetical protein
MPVTRENYSRVQELRSQIEVALEERRSSKGKTRVRAFTKSILEATSYPDEDAVLDSVAPIVDPVFDNLLKRTVELTGRFTCQYVCRQQIEAVREQYRQNKWIFEEAAFINGREILSDGEYKKRHNELSAQCQSAEDEYLLEHASAIWAATARSLQTVLDNLQSVTS